MEDTCQINIYSITLCTIIHYAQCGYMFALDEYHFNLYLHVYVMAQLLVVVREYICTPESLGVSYI